MSGHKKVIPSLAKLTKGVYSVGAQGAYVPAHHNLHGHMTFSKYAPG